MEKTSQLSLNGARWVLPEASFDDVQKIVNQFQVPELIARILQVRKIPFDKIDAFLNPRLRDHFPDPFSLQDMKGASEYIADAVEAKKNICIFGDFDVDGATSSAILFRFLKLCGLKPEIYVPDRLTEGYGPNIEAFKALKDKGIELVLLLDCGTTAFEVIKKGRELGLEIVIADHHEAEEILPEANFVINPKRQDDASGLEMLAACGVTFLLCVAVNKVLRERGYFDGDKASEPQIKNFLDIVALGTVCDMVPLKGANRLFVKTGFEISKKSENVGLKSLVNVSGMTGPLTPYHAGFVLGPRINAGSRVHRSDLGAKLLSTDDKREADDIAWALNDCNDKRKSIQAEMEREAIFQVKESRAEDDPVIIVWKEGWHTGLSGLVAGYLKEKYKKPACVIALIKNGEGGLEGRGSGRSVQGVHIAQGFIDARNSGLVLKGGGHAMAGGFSISPEKIEAFKEFMIEHVNSQIKGNVYIHENVVDSVLTVRGIDINTFKSSRRYLGPFGQDNPDLIFQFNNIKIFQADIVGRNHVRLLVKDWEGGKTIKAMAFRSVGTPLGDSLLNHNNRPFDLLGTLKLDTWNGAERIEMHIKDARHSMAS